MINLAKAVAKEIPDGWGFFVMVAPLKGQHHGKGSFSMTMHPDEALFHLNAGARAIQGMQDGSNDDIERIDI